MLSENSKELTDLLTGEHNHFTIRRLYNEKKQLAVVHVLNSAGKIYKCLFYDEGRRLTNISMYNSETGREIKNITFRNDGKTVSSVREYNRETIKLSKVTFYKKDGKSPSSVIKYDKYGDEAQFTLYCDDGEVITEYL